MRARRFLGEHPVVRAIIAAAAPLARSGRAIVVVGERGTGKELFARQMHAAVALPEDRFVCIDCAEASADRIARELFERGGGWRRAVAGTLLLDDLPSLPLDLQRRLLADLRERSGGAGTAPAPLLVASLTQEMTQACAVGHLDAALVGHLQPVEIVLPALRQRRCDIPLLVQHFLSLYAERHGVPPPAIETEALVLLWQHDWPGNVRELESVVERVVVLCRRGVVRSADLPAPLAPSVRMWSAGRRPPTAVDSLQRRPAL